MGESVKDWPVRVKRAAHEVMHGLARPLTWVLRGQVGAMQIGPVRALRLPEQRCGMPGEYRRIRWRRPALRGRWRIDPGEDSGCELVGLARQVSPGDFCCY